MDGLRITLSISARSGCGDTRVLHEPLGFAVADFFLAATALFDFPDAAETEEKTIVG